MRWWSWIVAQLARTERGTSLAVFRLLVGCTIAVEFWLTWYTGAAELLWHDREHDGYRMALASGHWLFGWLPTDTFTVDLLTFGTIAGALCVALGLGTRVLALPLIATCQALFSLSAGAGGGHDRMFTISLFFLAFAQSEATLSLTCWLKNRTWTSPTRVPAWPRDVLTWNLALIYTSAGLVKLSAEWLPQGDFRAVYNTLLTPHWARQDWAWLVGPLFPLTQLGTVVTVLWEASWMAVPLWLLLRARERTGWKARVAGVDVRSAYVVLGFVMHGTLLLFTNLGPFTAITLAWYAVLYRPDEWEAGLRRLGFTISSTNPQIEDQQPQPSR